VSIRALALLPLLLLASACGKGTVSATLLVVEVGSNLTTGSDIDEVALSVLRPGDRRSDQSYALGAGRNQLPLRVGLLPGDGPGAATEEVSITATGKLRGARVVEQQATVRFVENQKLLLTLFLARECRSGPCANDPERTCAAGGDCVPRRRANLPTFNPDAPRGDAGTAGDGPRDMAPGGSDGPAGQDGPVVPPPDGPPPGDAGCTCTSDDNPCTDEVCEGASCRSRNRADRSDCPNGLCVAGVCCTGCIDDMDRCLQGNSVMACGDGARDCQTCNDGKECTQDRCEGGACRADPQSGNSCSTGVCANGACHCGGAGEVCCAGSAPCMGGQSCQNGTCGDCGAENKPCCPGGSCASGMLCDTASVTCQRCGELGQRCCANDSCRTGLCTDNRVCEACGGPAQPCCPAGDACQANLTCASGTCRCGAIGQPCCGGAIPCLPDADMCNGAEVCQQGMCVRSAPVTCRALDGCHDVGQCDPTSGRCSDPAKPNNTPCGGTNMCTQGSCQQGVCVGAGTPTVCNDNNPCTQDSCRPDTGCAFTPIGAGMACTNDNNSCTADLCDAAGKCAHTPIREGQSCTPTTGGVGNCQSGYCCPGPAGGPACI
jgi:hypothetical protein